MSDFEQWRDNYGLSISKVQMDILQGIHDNLVRRRFDALFARTPDLSKTFPVASNLAEDELQGYVTGYRMAWQEAIDTINEFRFMPSESREIEEGL